MRGASTRSGAVVLLAVLLVSGCEGNRGRTLGRTSDTASRAPVPGVAPGINAAMLVGGLKNPYTGDPGAIQTGREFFNAFNCSGCHSGYAGGGMGPNLRDSVWIYGSTDASLFATISAGRPNGMPAWGGKIPKDEIWRIIAYLRTLGTKDEPEKPPTPTRTTMSAAEKEAS